MAFTLDIDRNPSGFPVWVPRGTRGQSRRDPRRGTQTGPICDTVRLGFDIHADILINCTGYNVTNYFRCEATAKIPSKMAPQTASGGILENGLNATGPTNLTRSLHPVGCNMQLDTAQI